MTPDRPDPQWDARQRHWARKLGRLRLGAEPIEEQVARYRRVTLLLTAIPAALALMFVGLFTAFRRPDVGALLSLVLLLPVVAIAWLDFALLRSRAAGYLRELRAYEEQEKIKTGKRQDQQDRNRKSGI
jgi:hypothetical protein